MLDPLPTADALATFYAEGYYAMVDNNERAPDIARTRRGGSEAEDQHRWLQETLHRDIIDVLGAHAPGPRVLDVGCGMGVLLADLVDAGFAAEGVDIAPDVVRAARARGLEVRTGALADLFDEGIRARYDAICWLSALEHTLDPAGEVAIAARLLAPGGLLIVRAGNEFNPLQEAAVSALGMERWWIKAPDKLHYLNFEAIEAMMRAAGVAPIERRSDFPMEMFLLMGLDYLHDRATGEECHRRRVAFERALPAAVRRSLYRAFADIGVGRCTFCVGQKPGGAARP
jgi:SAM-dependent methyltransferase